MSEIAHSLERYAVIIPIFIIENIPYVLLALKTGGEKIEQENGSTYTTKRQWVFPGGGVKTEEHSVDGALRECQEETGVIISIHDLYPKMYRTTVSSKKHTLTNLQSTVLLNIKAGTPKYIFKIIDPEIEKSTLFPVSALSKLLKVKVAHAPLSPLHHMFLREVLDVNKSYPYVKDIIELL